MDSNERTDNDERTDMMKEQIPVKTDTDKNGKGEAVHDSDTGSGR